MFTDEQHAGVLTKPVEGTLFWSAPQLFVEFDRMMKLPGEYSLACVRSVAVTVTN